MAEEIVNDVLVETSIVLIAKRGRITCSGDNRRIGEVTHDAGREIRAYARDRRVFLPGEDADAVADTDGRI